VLLSGITFTGYAQNIGKPNNLEVLESNKSKGLNRIAKIG